MSFEITQQQTAAAEKMIDQLLAKKEVISFGSAAIELGLIKETKQFRGSICSPIVKIVEDAVEGASALLVDQSGRYATRKETENHPAFLTAHNYTVIPAYKPKTNRKGGKMKLAKTLLAFSKENGCTVEEAIDLYKISSQL